MTGIDVLLDEISPYQSRRVVVECDSHTTAAYLLDARGRIRVPVWLANHEIAPRTSESGGLYEGSEVTYRGVKIGKVSKMISSRSRRMESASSISSGVAVKA